MTEQVLALVWDDKGQDPRVFYIPNTEENEKLLQAVNGSYINEDMDEDTEKALAKVDTHTIKIPEGITPEEYYGEHLLEHIESSDFGKWLEYEVDLGKKDPHEVVSVYVAGFIC